MNGQMTLRICSLCGAAWLALALSACAGGDGPKLAYEPAPGSYVTVPIKSGETPAGVAKRYHVEKDDVLAMNNLTDPNRRL